MSADDHPRGQVPVRPGLAASRYRIGDLELDVAAANLRRGGERLPLPPRTLELLVELVRAWPGLVRRHDLLERVWPDEHVSDQTLSQRILLLRRALGDDAERPVYVAGERGFGYRLLGPVHRLALDGSRPHAATAAADGSPYPGLLPFTEADAGHFFGREAEAHVVWERLTRRPLLAVIGPSGAGKTSFVRAGVIPSRPEGWAAIACTPGTSPLRSLARALAPEVAGDAEAVAGLLDGGLGPLREVVDRWRRAHDRALVVVDQFEEVFTLAPPEERRSFVDLLGDVGASAGLNALLVLRDDFLMRCHEHERLSPVFQELVPLAPLAGTALRRALVEPARGEGYEFEDADLVEEMIAAVEGERAALPLLAFAVARLWEMRDRERRRLTRAAYRQVGGVGGALAQHADETLARIGPAREGVVREIFRNLVTAQGTRAACDVGDLLSALPREGSEHTLEELVRARLLTSFDGDGTADARRSRRVEIVHESLLHAWPHLVRWRAQDEEGAVLRDQLRQAARLWKERERPAELLWTGRSYRELALWCERYPGSLTADESAFVRAVTINERHRRRRARAAGLGAILALAGIAAAIAVSRQQAVAEREHAVAAARRAQASHLVALGRVELDRDPTTALAFARASLEQADTREAKLLTVEALWRSPTARVLQLGPEMSGLGRVSFAPDASWLAGAGFGEKVALLPRDGGSPLLLGGHPALADPRDVLFSPRGDRLLTWGVRDPLIRLWGLDGRPAGTLPGPAQVVQARADDELVAWGPVPGDPARRQLRAIRLSSGRAHALATWSPGWDVGTDHAGMRAPTSVDPSATWLAYARGSEVLLHRLADSDDRRDVTLGRHAAKVLDVSFDPSGQRLLSADQAGELRLWAPGARRLLRSLQGAPIHERGHAAFSPDGSRIAWASGTDRAVHVWDLEAPPAAALLALRRSGNVDPGDPAFAPDGSWLASVDLGGHVAFWPMRQPYSRVVAAHTDGPLFDLAFSPDSSLLASCGRDGVRLTRIVPSAPTLTHLDLGADYFCYGIAWDREGRRLAVAAPQQGVLVVDRVGGEPRRVLRQPSQTVALSGVAWDPSGTTLAVGSHYGASPEEVRLYAVDIRTGASMSWPVGLPGSAGRPFADGARDVRFSHDGRLLTAGGGGVRRWDLRTGASELLAGGPGSMAALDTSRDGRRLVAVVGHGRIGAQPLGQPGVLVVDLVTGAQRTIRNHGSELTRTIATDSAGERVVTGDGSGMVRVGSASGGDPHLLLGHQGAVERLAVSPDGRWIASSSGAEIRLWPMPDTSRTPLHALPYEELTAKLDSLTNVRVVEDAASPSGYRVELGPFPGWRDTPAR